VPCSSLLSAFLQGKPVFASLYCDSLALSLQHLDGLRTRTMSMFRSGIPGRPPIFHAINHTNRFHTDRTVVPQNTDDYESLNYDGAPALGSESTQPHGAWSRPYQAGYVVSYGVKFSSEKLLAVSPSLTCFLTTHFVLFLSNSHHHQLD
jgi:hypothetical protein